MHPGGPIAWASVLPDALYPDLWLTGVAKEELTSLPDDRPWFLWVSFPGPHEPFDVPARWCRTRSIPPPAPRPQDPEQLRRLAPPDSVLAGKIKRGPRSSAGGTRGSSTGLRQPLGAVGPAGG